LWKLTGRLSVWKDPLKKLKSLPSNRIDDNCRSSGRFSGVSVNGVLGLGLGHFPEQKSAFPALKAFSVLVDVSGRHVLLLTVDRVFVLVNLWQYSGTSI